MTRRSPAATLRAASHASPIYLYKYGGHRTAFKAYVLAATACHAQQERLCKATVESGRWIVEAARRGGKGKKGA